MNELYLKHRYARLQYLNAVYIFLLVSFEVYLSVRGHNRLMFNYGVLIISVALVAALFAMSYYSGFRDRYIGVLMNVLGVVTLIIYAYTFLLNPDMFHRILAVAFLMVYLGTVARERIYRILAVITLLLILTMIMMVEGSIDEKILYLILNVAVVVRYASKSRYDASFNHDVYAVYREQAIMAEHMNEAYSLNEAIWNEQGDKVIDYKVIAVNVAFEKMTGLNRHDICGKRVMEVLPETEPYWLDTFASVLKKQTEYTFVNYAGALGKYFKMTTYPISSDQFVTLCLDVTDSIEIERTLKDKIKEAEKANQFKSQFLRDVNHKLRTPLNGMMGMAQLIALEDLKESTKELFDVMMVEMDHTRNIINQISEYIELKEDTYLITKNNIVIDIQDIKGQFSESRDVEIQVVMSNGDGLGVLYYEKKVFERVLSTLITNGIKHSRSRRIQIAVKLTKDIEALKDYVEVSVIDYGKGIEQDELPLIFNQLHHQDFINIYRGEGHMSLPLCKELLNHIGGDLSCSSNEETGATFTMQLPIFEQISK